MIEGDPGLEVTSTVPPVPTFDQIRSVCHICTLHNGSCAVCDFSVSYFSGKLNLQNFSGTRGKRTYLS